MESSHASVGAIPRPQALGRRLLAFLAASALAAACTADSRVRTEGAFAIEPTTAPATTPPAPPVAAPDADTSPDDNIHPGHSQPQDDNPHPDTAPRGPARDTGDGVGDNLFPALGNPGIDVENYHVTLAYDAEADAVAGSVTLTILPMQDRDEFTLDSVGIDVTAVTVDGDAAEFRAEEVELRVTTPTEMLAGKRIEVSVDYTATPDAGRSLAGLPNGWFHTDSGSYVLNEPDGARTWLPSNDHPLDKATWTFEITVPEGLVAVANGELVSQTAVPAGTTWVWREGRPMATYLIQLLTGDYEIIEGEGPNGLPLLSVLLDGDRELMQPYLDTIDDQIDFFDDYFGPYPLDTYGIAITDSFGGLAMETQSRSMFSRNDFSSGELGYVQELLLSHELTHMWFGNAVTFGVWQDIWLAEAFATYGQWMWLDHVGQAPLDDLAGGALDDKMSSAHSTAEPPVEELFGPNSYGGGAVVLHALRRSIGDETFFALLQRWVADNNGESKVTADFIQLASDVAACDLGKFFDDWLFARRPPGEYPAATNACS